MKNLINLTKDEILDLLSKNFEINIIKRGINYAGAGNVKEVKDLSPNYIYGKVQGTETYKTEVAYTKGKLYTNCTCPYGSYCKHAVALLLYRTDSNIYKSNANNLLSLEEFKKRLMRTLLNSGFVSFNLLEWEKIIQTYPIEQIKNFTLELVKSISNLYDAGEIPYIESYFPYIDNLLIPILKILPVGEKSKFFFNVFNKMGEYILIGNFAEHFATFGHEDKIFIKENVLKNNFYSYSILMPYLLAFLED